jgi:hypothetical protein
VNPSHPSASVHPRRPPATIGPGVAGIDAINALAVPSPVPRPLTGPAWSFLSGAGRAS